MNDIQKHLLKMLGDFIQVCEKHHLTYFVDCGTMLGAVRHQGFIPWDDDVDVSMPRKDYEKFLSLQYEFEGTPYFIQTWKTDPHYTYCFAKLRDSSTTFIENFFANHRYNHGMWIDIFPIDGMSYKQKPREKCANRVRFVWYMSYLSYLPQLFRKPKKGTILKDIGLDIVASIFWIMDAFHWRNRVVEAHLKHYDLDKSVLGGNYYDFKPKRQAVDTKFYKQFIQVPFEGMMVNIVKDYDEYLTLMYGDWRQLPPKEQQIGTHHNKGVSLSEGYLDYMREHKI